MKINVSTCMYTLLQNMPAFEKSTHCIRNAVYILIEEQSLIDVQKSLQQKTYHIKFIPNAR